MKHGDDKYLVGLPKDLEEAIETLLTFYSSAPDAGAIIDMDEEQFVTACHHVAGRFIRNSWYLWWWEGHPYEEWPKSKPELTKWFNNYNIWHADDISSIIMKSAWRHVHKQPLNIERQAEHYIEFWKDQGFKDGNPFIKD